MQHWSTFALSRMATLGEVSDVLRGVFGEFHPNG
jgi:hypothetical protein